MVKSLKEFEAEALKLPSKERAILAEHLIESLDSIDNAENERLWVEEAERRFQEFKKGNVPARPVEDALRDAKASLA
jgi:putative addiction module component (TIGR02574 family)